MPKLQLPLERFQHWVLASVAKDHGNFVGIEGSNLMVALARLAQC